MAPLSAPLLSESGTQRRQGEETNSTFANEAGNSWQMSRPPLQRPPLKQKNQASPHARKRDASKTKLIIGKNVSDGLLSINGVDLTISRYIGRIANGTNLSDLKGYIEGQGVNIVALEQLATKHDSFQSYKLVVRRVDLAKIEDENFWPTGVVIRRFFKPKQSSADGAVAVVPISLDG